MDKMTDAAFSVDPDRAAQLDIGPFVRQEGRAPFEHPLVIATAPAAQPQAGFAFPPRASASNGRGLWLSWLTQRFGRAG